MKNIKGQPYNIKEPIIGRVTYKNSLLNRNKILVSNKLPLFSYGIKAIISSVAICNKKYANISTQDTSLNEGDVVTITPDGVINVIWESNLKFNAVFITDYCNSKCIMCPQTNPKNPKSYINTSKKMLELASYSKNCTIGLTGGEPTLEIDGVIEIIKICNHKFKDSLLLFLTNGKSFADINLLKKITILKYPNILFAVPLYADNSSEHDYIVGSPNSFNQTINGLYNLAKLGQRIEIRVVIIKQNYQKLKNLAEFIYRNLPFVHHVVLMGMESSGLAKENINAVFIDPVDYAFELKETMQHFIQRDMDVSLYNLPFCLLDKSLWKYAKDSISSWKKVYSDKCEGCYKKETCSGLFSTSIIQSKNIQPIKVSTS